MKRESGYYWVKIDGKWEIGLYDRKLQRWYFVYTMIDYIDRYFDEINETRILNPDEQANKEAYRWGWRVPTKQDIEEIEKILKPSDDNDKNN